MQRTSELRASALGAPADASETPGSAKGSSAKNQKSAPSVLERFLSLAVAGALLSVALWLLALAETEFQSDFTASPARLLVQRWGEGRSARPGRSQWENAVRELHQASDLQPSDPSLHQTLGNAWLVGTAQPWASTIERVLWTEQAIYHYRESTTLRPADGMTWALIANTLASSGEFGHHMQLAAQKALQLGPNEAHVHETLMPVVLEHWDRVHPSMRQWANTLFARGTARQREAINRLGKKYGRQLTSSEDPSQRP